MLGERICGGRACLLASLRCGCLGGQGPDALAYLARRPWLAIRPMALSVRSQLNDVTGVLECGVDPLGNLPRASLGMEVSLLLQ